MRQFNIDKAALVFYPGARGGAYAAQVAGLLLPWLSSTAARVKSRQVTFGIRYAQCFHPRVAPETDPR